MTVLVLTADDDETATRVCDAFDDRGADHARMDLGDFPEKLAVTATLHPGSGWSGVLSSRDRDLPLAEISAVTWALGVGDEVAWRMFLGDAAVCRIDTSGTVPMLLGFSDTGAADRVAH